MSRTRPELEASGGKSESVGAIATFPFQPGRARSRIEDGRLDFEIKLGSYAKALIRSAIGAQSPLAGSSLRGTCRSVDAGILASSRCWSRVTSSGEFSVRYTSAGGA